jgi:hypothetical protein
MFRSSDVELQQLRAMLVQHRYIIKNYLGVSVSDKLSGIAIPSKMVAKGIAQTLLSKLGLKLTYVGRLEVGIIGNGFISL